MGEGLLGRSKSPPHRRTPEDPETLWSTRSQCHGLRNTSTCDRQEVSSGSVTEHGPRWAQVGGAMSGISVLQLTA